MKFNKMRTKIILQRQLFTRLFSREFSTANFRCSAKLEVLPKKSLVDERLKSTIISNLTPNTPVTLKLSVTNNVNLNYASKTEFKADSNGVVDLLNSVPTCGAYEDPDLMSIYWTMKYQTDSDTRFWPLKINNGLQCTYQVYEKENELIAEETVYRDYMGDGVQRIEIKTGKIRGTLFLPSGPGPFPAVITLYGGIHKGNVVEEKSAMFASRGIASLALAYFGVPDLPKRYVE